MSLLLVLVSSTDDEVPKGGTHSEPRIFSSEVVLVVVLLQPVEPAPFVL